MKKIETIQVTGPENDCIKNTKMILLALMLLFMLSGSLFAQSTIDDKPINADLLKQDFKMLRDSLQDLHAGLYTYKSKAQVERLFDQCEAKLDQPMTLIQFYCLVRYVVSGIEDGHTSAFLPPAVNKALLSQTSFFPLLIRFIGNKAYITNDNDGFIAGTEITAVDHHPINNLRKELFSYIQSDGSTQSGKYADMNDGDSPFLYLYNLVYGDKDSFAINYINTTGEKKERQVKASFLKDIPGRPEPVPVTQYLSLAYPSRDLALLTIKSFLNNKLEVTHENFENFLQSSFAEISKKQVNTLIIDVRNNGGGHDGNGALLASYLTSRPFSYYTSIVTTKGTITVNEEEQLGIQQPSVNNFKGRVDILINGKSFSTTSDFCKVAKQFPNIKFVGEETEGGYYGNTSGARSTLFLKNTQIKVNIPLWREKTAGKKTKFKDRGIIPDYPLTPAITDVLHKKDIQMEFALKIAGKD